MHAAGQAPGAADPCPIMSRQALPVGRLLYVTLRLAKVLTWIPLHTALRSSSPIVLRSKLRLQAGCSLRGGCALQMHDDSGDMSEIKVPRLGRPTMWNLTDRMPSVRSVGTLCGDSMCRLHPTATIAQPRLKESPDAFCLDPCATLSIWR